MGISDQTLGKNITVIKVKHLSSSISTIAESLSLELFKIQQILEQPAHIGPALGRRQGLEATSCLSLHDYRISSISLVFNYCFVSVCQRKHTRVPALSPHLAKPSPVNKLKNFKVHHFFFVQKFSLLQDNNESSSNRRLGFSGRCKAVRVFYVEQVLVWIPEGRANTRFVLLL